ncbi:hypothetical protein [Teichococcus vastitatis]|uniref:Uncharacterized protein n=1 Tax=Teichococcus vastitatis TaxID=2307076 RepID=A0ABS9W689_9PROT|nr:hypothetical protein [Pseudoroseomonas vastitatis]MCI0754420.1 hypothetical protein [Pseudoroseomonas vastitatis]
MQNAVTTAPRMKRRETVPEQLPRFLAWRPFQEEPSRRDQPARSPQPRPASQCAVTPGQVPRAG